MNMIDKERVVAEIEKRLDKLYNLLPDASKVENGNITIPESYNTGRYIALESFRKFLDTLEVKEVNLDKEINDYISNNFFGSQTLGFFANRTKEEPNDQDIALCAKHFYELGLKSK